MKNEGNWSIAAIAVLGLLAIASHASAMAPEDLPEDRPEDLPEDLPEGLPEGLSESLVVERPRGTYVEVDAARAWSAVRPVSNAGQSHILFLQRCEGGYTVRSGYGGSLVDESLILPPGWEVQLPPFPYEDEVWDELVDRVRGLFAPFDIIVTDVDPGNQPHDEAVICGTYDMIGYPNPAAGIAPGTCSVIPNAITFTFPTAHWGNTREMADTVGQEVAHAWGLDHQMLCNDPMTYLTRCGDRDFQDVDANCGEYEPRGCSCGGYTQNSFQHISGVLGAVGTSSTIIASPHTGDVFVPQESFEIVLDIDETEVDRAAVFIDGDYMGRDVDPPFGPWPVSLSEGTYELHVTITSPDGQTTRSNTVTIAVNADGIPPPPEGSTENVQSELPEELDGLNFGEDGGVITGCGCTTGGRSPGAPGLLLLGLLGWRRRSRGSSGRPARPAAVPWVARRLT